MSAPEKLNDIYVDEMKDLWSANDQMLKVPKTITTKASDPKLKELIAGQDERVSKEHCKGMEGLVEAQAAALEIVFASNVSPLGAGAATFRVASGDTGSAWSDPDPALLAALRRNQKVKPVSACTVPANGGFVTETATGQRALVFHARPDRCETPDDCLVSAGYHEANMSAQHNPYRVRRSGGRWTATVEQPGPIT